MINQNIIHLARTQEYQLQVIASNCTDWAQLTIHLYQIYNKLRIKKYSKTIQYKQPKIFNCEQLSWIQILRNKQRYWVQIQKGNIVMMLNDKQYKTIVLDQRPNDLYQIANQIQSLNSRISKLQNMNQNEQKNQDCKLVKSTNYINKSKATFAPYILPLIIITIIGFNASLITDTHSINNRRFLNQLTQKNNIVSASSFINQKALDGITKMTTTLIEKLQALEQTGKSNEAAINDLKAAIQRHESSLANSNEKLRSQIIEIKMSIKSLQDVKNTSSANEQQQKQQKKVVSMADPQSKYYSSFAIQQQFIEYISSNATYYQLLGKYLIKQKSINTFIIVKTKQQRLFIGIVDRRYINDAHSSFQKQYISYSVSRGYLLVNNQWTDGSKSKEGDVLVMQVVGDTITWKVNFQIRQSYKNPIISDNSINWVPFISMRDTGDIVSWQ